MMVEFAPEAVVTMRAADLLPIIMPLKADRASLRQSAERLTRRGIQVPRGGIWIARELYAHSPNFKAQSYIASHSRD
jgi:hypothetical protein